jgi:gentisate 1,2-dioxygenase
MPRRGTGTRSWAAIVLMNPGEVQRPHRHNSIAVDIVISAEPGSYTLLGKAVDDEGNIINPHRVDWESQAAFVTPPHLWHGHYNESGKPAMVMAVQDAGFYEHMRTLNIQFTGLKTTGREYKA